MSATNLASTSTSTTLPSGAIGESPERAKGKGRRPTIRWPWIVVGIAWGAALLAALTGQSYLVDHDYLIESGNLSLPVAMLVFIACWQVMIAAMMLPSSMPMV